MISPAVAIAAPTLAEGVRDGHPHRSCVEAALGKLRGGGVVVVVTGEAECRVGHLAMCARHTTPAAVNFMAARGRGVVSLAISQADIDRLQLPMQQRPNGPMGRAAPVSIEARKGVSTGISAADRARTIQVAADPASTPQDLVSPGHIFPLLAKDEGVFALPGPAEMAADLSRLAGFAGTSVICAILDDDGNQADWEGLQAISASFQLPVVTAADLLDHRCRYDRQVELAREKSLSTVVDGQLRAVVYRSAVSGSEVLAIVRESDSTSHSPVSVQQGLLLADQIETGRSARGFHGAISEAERRGHGALIILSERSGAALSAALDDEDERQPIPFAGWALAARVLCELGFSRVELLDAPAEGRSVLRQLGFEVR